MYPYWKAHLITGKTLSKHQIVWDQMLQKKRELDWTLDLIATGDILKINRLELVYGFMCSVSLDIPESGTAFQFIRSAKGLDPNRGVFDSVEAQIIGRVHDKENGLCEGWIWDRVQGLIKYEDADINNFPSWRVGLMPPGELNLAVLGVRL